MPQSSASLPSAIARRSAITFSTRECSLNPSGTSVTFFARDLSVRIGTRVSPATVQWCPLKTLQSIW